MHDGLSLFYLLVFQCLCLLLGIRSNRRVVSRPRALDTQSSLSARRTISSVVSKCLKSTTIQRISSLKTNSMLSGLSTTQPVSGLINLAQEISHSEGHSTLHAKFKKIKCSSSVDATPQMKGTMTPSTLNYVCLNLFSCFPMASTSQSEISRTSQKRNEQDRRTRTKSLSLYDLL